MVSAWRWTNKFGQAGRIGVQRGRLYRQSSGRSKRICLVRLADKVSLLIGRVVQGQPQKPTPLAWQKAFQAAEREFEPTKLLLLVGAAEGAIFLRLQETEEKLSAEEREAITKATQKLRQIQIERLNYPEWESES